MKYYQGTKRKHLFLLFMMLGLVITVYPNNKTVFNATSFSDSSFKDWYYTPTGVFGRTVLNKTINRPYVKISRQKDSLVDVYKYNAAGFLVNTTVIKFQNGMISLITETDQWGYTYDSVYYVPSGPDEFITKEKIRGENPNMPCLFLKYIFRQNLIKEIFCLSDSTKPGYNRDGVSHYVFERYNDPARFGLIKSVAFFGDIDNSVMSRKSGCHKIINSYDNEGNLITQSAYGLKDEPVIDIAGSFKTIMKYNRNGDQTEIDYYDLEGNMVNQMLGFSRKINDYTDGLLIKETCYDESFKIIQPLKILDKIAITEHKYDAQGNEIQKAFFDEEYLPMNNTKGIHKIMFSYNKAGMLTDISYFNAKGYAVNYEPGIHQYHLERNSKGQIISKTFFDINQYPTKQFSDGVLEIKYSYDNWGRIERTSFWVNDSVKMLNVFGCHEILNNYNEQGLVESIEFFDKESKPVVNGAGYYKVILKYNNDALLAERKYFNTAGPAMLYDSSHFIWNFNCIRYNYDFNNRVSSLEYLDVQGNPVSAHIKLESGGEIKCKKVGFTYKDDKVASEIFTSNEGDPIMIDCSQKNCLMTSGVTITLKDKDLLKDQELLHQKIVGAKIEDSLFFGNQVAFLGKDTMLFFLNSTATRLTGQSCATFYRIAQVTKYFQITGTVSDHYIDSGNLAATLAYENGYLNGPVVFYYRNGAVKERGEYKMNVRSGVWDYFYETGIKAKTIKFTNGIPFLMDCFAENGSPLVKDGNGFFEGSVVTGSADIPAINSVSGEIKNGMQNGEWKLYKAFSREPTNIEKFSEGKFIKGFVLSPLGKVPYQDKRYFTTFDGIHFGEQIVDQYGQDHLCAFFGKKISADRELISDEKNFYELNYGLRNILKDNRYKDYAGWVFIDIHYDSTGAIANKYVRLYSPNDNFKKDILNMLDKLNNHPVVKADGRRVGFEKFYIILVDTNDVGIPEELLRKQRSLKF